MDPEPPSYSSASSGPQDGGSFWRLRGEAPGLPHAERHAGNATDHGESSEEEFNEPPNPPKRISKNALVLEAGGLFRRRYTEGYAKRALSISRYKDMVSETERTIETITRERDEDLSFYNAVERIRQSGGLPEDADPELREAYSELSQMQPRNRYLEDEERITTQMEIAAWITSLNVRAATEQRWRL